MLGKLFKYEWKSVSLLLLILHGALLVYSLIGRIGFELYFSSYASNSVVNAANITMVFYLIVYVVGIIAVVLLTMLYLAMRIQKSLFADEGYLTHTLPVTPAKLLWSKMFIFWLWTFIDMVVVIASVFILIANKLTFTTIINSLSQMWSVLSSVSGYSSFLNSLIYALELITRYFFYETTLLIFAICLGSLFKNHKVLGAIVSFFGLTIISNIVTLIILGQVLTGGFTSVVVTTPAGSNTQAAPSAIYLFSIAWYLLISAVFFLGSRYILSKKLNLE